MNLNEYQQLSKRTAAYNGEPKNQQEFENGLGNYAMGLVGEWFEFQVELNKLTEEGPFEQVTKELGDVLHYAVGLLSMLGVSITDLDVSHKVEWGQVEQALSNILEIPKKHIYHRHELEKLTLISSVHDVIAHLRYELGDLSEAMEMNINKLKTRYPDKFSTENSIKRVDVEGKA